VSNGLELAFGMSTNLQICLGKCVIIGSLPWRGKKSIAISNLFFFEGESYYFEIFNLVKAVSLGFRLIYHTNHGPSVIRQKSKCIDGY
jgi:hypothetical protein